MLPFLQSRLRSFGYAFRGIWIFFRSQTNAKIHLLATVVIVAMGLWLTLSPEEWTMITLCIALVLVAEAINTALEFLVDLVSPQQHPLAGKVKDVAAGAVLIAVLLCGVVWAIIFIPKLMALA